MGKSNVLNDRMITNIEMSDESKKLAEKVIKKRTKELGEFYEKNTNGKIKLEWKIDISDDNYYDTKLDSKISTIENLEEQLNRHIKEKARLEENIKAKKEKTETKKEKKQNKKKKKNDMMLLSMVFNKVPTKIDESGKTDEENLPEGTRYKTSRKKIAKNVKELAEDDKVTQRFAPITEQVMSILHNLNRIEKTIEDDLKKPGKSHLVIASEHTNLININKSKLDCVKEIHNISKTVTTTEFKNESIKDNEATGDAMINNLGLALLRGEIGKNDDIVKNKKDKKKNKKKEYDKMEDGGSSYNKYDDISDAKLAKALANKMSKGDGLTVYQKNIEWEDKYVFGVRVDEDNPKDWKFIPIDNDGKLIKDFPKDLMRKPKGYKIKFNYESGKAKDQYGNNYKIYYKK